MLLLLKLPNLRVILRILRRMLLLEVLSCLAGLLERLLLLLGLSFVALCFQYGSDLHGRVLSAA